MKHIIIGILTLFTMNLNARIMTSPQDAVVQLFNATDKGQWESVRSLFHEKVRLDYSSMNGNPATELTPGQIVEAWQGILPGFESTHHQIGNIQATTEGKSAHVFCYGTASHYLTDEKGSIWWVVGSYDFDLIKVAKGIWQITAMKFNFKYQDGNPELANKAMERQQTMLTPANQTPTNSTQIQMKKVNFSSEGAKLSGHLYFPPEFDPAKRYPAIIVSGSWTTVKEQMAGLYAEKLAHEGFITLAFDFRNFGESEGEPRFFESPSLKRTDIKNAVTFLETVPEVDPTRIGSFGVCAGAMYTLMAAAEDDRIKSVVTAASWLHDAEAVKLFYGGEEGVSQRLAAAREAKKTYADNGTVTYIPTISTEDTSAAMYGPYDYYLNPERGAIAEWSNDKFAVMSWEDWLTADPMTTAPQLQKPTLMIHSDGAVLPQYTKNYFEQIGTDDKKLYWMETELESPYHQFNYYDQEGEVNESVEQAANWFRTRM